MDNAILWYNVKHFGSFEGEGGLVDLTTTANDSHKDLWCSINGHCVNLITAIMGANGSGKTTLLKPIPFLAWLFWSIPAKVSDVLMINTNKPITAPTTMNVCFIVGGKEYTYEISAVDFFIIEEKLYLRNENNKNVYIFKRNLCKDKIKDYRNGILEVKNNREMEVFLKTLEYDYVEKKEYFPLGNAEAERTPCNTSIISAARRVGVDLANEIAHYITSFSNVNAMGRTVYDFEDLGEIASYLYDDPEIFKKLKNIVKRWDLGLADIVIEREKSTDPNGKEEYYYQVKGIHEKEDGERFELPMSFESSGTQGAFIRLFQLLSSLEDGNPCFVDELGDDLHPHMIKPIMELFTNKETNPHGSQLIFTCHKPELINYLGKYRIIITEKKFNKSEAFRLDDFPASEARVDDNLAAKYLAGAFGGIPDL